MQLDFPRVNLEQDDSALILQSDKPLHTLSSAVVGGGFAQVQNIINRHVDKNYDCRDPISDMQAFVAKRGLSGPFVGLLTAVWLHQARAVTERDEELTICAVITAGVSNATAAGVSLPYPASPGTINVILLVDGRLTAGAMVNLVQTITEAKTAVLLERGVQTKAGQPATGTSTDAVVVACTERSERGPKQIYAGPLTTVGYLSGRCVRIALMEALDAPRNID